MVFPSLNRAQMGAYTTILLCYLALIATAQATPNPLQHPLIPAYPNYISQLTQYVESQGFTTPLEIQTVIIHELIHIDSFTHKGFYIDGQYYEPYLTRSAWPSLNNRTIAPLIPESARDAIYTNYVLAAPDNHLGNVIDEINAYAQTLPTLCILEPISAAKQIRMLTGHLALADQYLRILSERNPAEYIALTKNRQSRGALETIIANAYKTLTTCYKIPEANPVAVPKINTRKFANEP